MRHGKPDYATLKKATDSKRIAYPKPDGKITFDRLSSVFISNTNHEEDQPVHLVLRDPSIPIKVNLPEYAEPAQRYCPAGVYEVVEEQARSTVPDQRAELRPLQNLRHQGSGAEHQLGHARRRRRPQLFEYVRRRLKTSSAHRCDVPGPGGLRRACAQLDESPADKEADRQANAFSTYLSARFAAGQHEMPEAARYYAQSLKNDPGNAEVLSLAFFFASTSGDMDGAGKYATQMVAKAPDERSARLALAVIAFKHKDYAGARKNLSLSAKGPFQSLVVSLFDAWARGCQRRRGGRDGRHENSGRRKAGPKGLPPFTPP